VAAQAAIELHPGMFRLKIQPGHRRRCQCTRRDAPLGGSPSARAARARCSDTAWPQRGLMHSPRGRTPKPLIGDEELTRSVVAASRTMAITLAAVPLLHESEHAAGVADQDSREAGGDPIAPAASIPASARRPASRPIGSEKNP
jgi:hypothetical protein